MNNSWVTAVLPLGLVLGTLAIMASRTLTPVRAQPKGKVELELGLPFLQRALARRADVLSVCGVLAIAGGALTSQRVISPGLSFLALLAMVGMIAKRQRYVFTSQGVMPNNASFRSWSDFDDVRVGAGKVVLHSSTRLASLSLYLPSSRRDDVVRLIRRHITPAAPAPRRATADRPRRRAV